ncbi:MAG: PAAR domain-containing protein [Bacteroidales bacterium]|nr:PAAR domain-containing protein [Bacteroidales bacterium]
MSFEKHEKNLDAISNWCVLVGNFWLKAVRTLFVTLHYILKKVMAGKPIAIVGSMHVCPMCSGIVPHVGGPISGPGSPNVFINGKPAALMGDMCCQHGQGYAGKHGQA